MVLFHQFAVGDTPTQETCRYGKQAGDAKESGERPLTSWSGVPQGHEEKAEHDGGENGQINLQTRPEPRPRFGRNEGLEGARYLELAHCPTSA